MARSGNRDRCIAADEEMVRAAWDTARDLELDEGCVVHVAMWATAQRGVWHIEVQAFSTRATDGARPLGGISSSFPNGVASTLSAFLFGKMNSLSQMVTNVRASELEETYGRTERRSPR
jgi:hypothetical protein